MRTYKTYLWSSPKIILDASSKAIPIQVDPILASRSARLKLNSSILEPSIFGELSNKLNRKFLDLPEI